MNPFQRYVVMLNKIDGVETPQEIIKEHVQFLQKLESRGQLEMCGPFSDFPGGMLVLKANSLEEAKDIANSDPFVQSGVRAMSLRTWELSCKENNHLGMGDNL